MASIATLLSQWDKLKKFLGIVLKAGLPETFFQKVIDDPEFRADFVAWADRRMNANPFEQTVEETLTAFRVQNELAAWGIPEEVYERLAKTAPAWPKGKDAYRSLRIRFGEGRDGMIQTFEAHVAAIKRVHDPKFSRWNLLLSGAVPFEGKDVERLRLLNGNDTHHAVVDWIIINDLSANRVREDVTSVRGPKSLADEGIVLAWLFPKRAQAIDYDEWCAWLCAGYEENVPESGGEECRHVPGVFRSTVTGKVDLLADRRENNDSYSSVPSLG